MPPAAEVQTAAQYASQGRQLLEQGRFAEALLALETALLFNPDLPGAQLDYAQALAQSGQVGAARSLASQTLERTDVPPGLRLALQLPQAPRGGPNIEQAPRLAAGAYLQIAQGSESNVNNATSSQFLTLQLPNGPVSLPLADTERPRAGTLRKLLAGASAALTLPVGEARLQANLSSRTPLQAEPNDRSTQAADISLSYVVPAATGRLVVQSVQQRLQLAREDIFQSQGLQVQYEVPLPRYQSWLTGACTLAPQMGLARQRYPASEPTNGLYRFYRLQASCLHTPEPGQPATSTYLAVGTGLDTPVDVTRPGGERLRREALVRHERRLTTLQWSVWTRWGYTQDTQPYSPLFGNLISSTQTLWVGAGVWQPLSPTLSIGLELESTRQTSNNALFELSNRSAYLGLRWINN